MDSQHRERLSVELEIKLLRQLALEWQDINHSYFKGVLATPLFRLSEARELLGEWSGGTRTLTISRSLILECPWHEVREVFKHEIAHQFVGEFLQADETAHGPVFKDTCARLGIASEARATVSARAEDDGRGDRMVARIRKLLALAESPNQHEAEAATVAAQRLMLKFNIDVERAYKSATSTRRYGYRYLGEPSGRIFEHERRLSCILTDYFFVEGIWVPAFRPRDGKRGNVLEICGQETNLVMAEHVYKFLLATADRLWKIYKIRHQLRANRNRRIFLAGVMDGFATKLASQQTEFQEQGLVWIPHADLNEYFRRRHPSIETVRRGGNRRNEAYTDGQTAGSEIVLSQPVADSSSQHPQRALPPAK